MSSTIDHLLSDHEVRVLRAFRDAKGTRVSVGAKGVLRDVTLCWPRQEIVLSWDREGRSESLYFRLDASDGPGNGRMRDYFELGRAVAPARVHREDLASRRDRNPVNPLPPLSPNLISEPEQFDRAVARIRALAARERFEEAELQVRTVLSWPDPAGGLLETLAESLTHAAAAYSDAPGPAVYRWLRARAIGLWYAWGSAATSGGEGTARGERIRRAEAQLPLR